jgi:hypothetical protein
MSVVLFIKVAEVTEHEALLNSTSLLLYQPRRVSFMSNLRFVLIV